MPKFFVLGCVKVEVGSLLFAMKGEKIDSQLESLDERLKACKEALEPFVDCPDTAVKHIEFLVASRHARAQEHAEIEELRRQVIQLEADRYQAYLEKNPPRCYVSGSVYGAIAAVWVFVIIAFFMVAAVARICGSDGWETAEISGLTGVGLLIFGLLLAGCLSWFRIIGIRDPKLTPGFQDDDDCC